MTLESPLNEALAYCIKHRLTFAAFRTPGGAVTLWAQQTPELDRVENGLWWELNDVFLLSPFDTPERVALIRSDVELTFGDAEPGWHRLMECTGALQAVRSGTRRVQSRVQFEGAVEKVRQACLSGDLEKAVLARTISLPATPEEAPGLFTEALAASPETCVCLVHTPEHGLWLGASPERMILAENDTIHVDAMAGTMTTERAPSDPAKWGDKEKHEQRLVTKTVVGTFIDLDIPSIVLHGPEVMHTGKIAHLRTRITASLEGRSVGDLVLALHPTPAVCGVPAKAAMECLIEMEEQERELYAGFWGPWSADGRMELFVNIRCMRVHADHADLFVGAGITAGSVPALEWEETEHKAESWRRLIPALQGARIS